MKLAYAPGEEGYLGVGRSLFELFWRLGEELASEEEYEGELGYRLPGGYKWGGYREVERLATVDAYQKATAHVAVEGATYEIKEQLKARKYRWDRYGRAWGKWIGWRRLVLEELDFLWSTGTYFWFIGIIYPATKYFEDIYREMVGRCVRAGVDPRQAMYEFGVRHAEEGLSMPGSWTRYYGEAFVLYLEKIGILDSP